MLNIITHVACNNFRGKHGICQIIHDEPDNVLRNDTLSHSKNTPYFITYILLHFSLSSVLAYLQIASVA
jgi:hypothetical protein